MEDSNIKSKPTTDSVHLCIPRVTTTNMRIVLVTQTAATDFEHFFHFLHIVNYSSSHSESSIWNEQISVKIIASEKNI